MGAVRTGKLLFILFLLGFAVFFGLDLATRGLERVQGPLDNGAEPVAASSSAGLGYPSSAASQAAHGDVRQGDSPDNHDSRVLRQPAGQVEVKESFLNHLSNRIGDALHKAAKALAGLIVSIFDSIIS